MATALILIIIAILLAAVAHVGCRVRAIARRLAATLVMVAREAPSVDGTSATISVKAVNWRTAGDVASACATSVQRPVPPRLHD